MLSFLILRCVNIPFVVPPHMPCGAPPTPESPRPHVQVSIQSDLNGVDTNATRVFYLVLNKTIPRVLFSCNSPH